MTICFIIYKQVTQQQLKTNFFSEWVGNYFWFHFTCVLQGADCSAI